MILVYPGSIPGSCESCVSLQRTLGGWEFNHWKWYTLPLGTLCCRGPWVVELRGGSLAHFFWPGGRCSRTSSIQVWGYLCPPCLTLKSPSCLSNLCIILLRGSLKSSEICLLHPGIFPWIAWPGPCTVKMRIQRVTWCGPWPTRCSSRCQEQTGRASATKSLKPVEPAEG